MDMCKRYTSYVFGRETSKGLNDACTAGNINVGLTNMC